MIDAVKGAIATMNEMLRWVLFVQRQQLVPRVPLPGALLAIRKNA